MINQERVRTLVDRYIETAGDFDIYVRGPSHEMQEAALLERELCPPFPMSFFTASPHQAMCAMGNIAGYLDNRKLDNIFLAVTYNEAIVIAAHRYHQSHKNSGGWQQSTRLKLNDWCKNRSLRMLYRDLEYERPEHEFPQVRNYLAVQALTRIDRNEISIDTFVSEQLRRIPFSMIA